MNTKRMDELIRTIEQYDEESVIYVQTDKDMDLKTKVVLVVPEDDETTKQIDQNGYFYFLEVFLVKEIIEAWLQWRQGVKPDLENTLEAVIYYSKNDTYLPA